MIFPDKKRAVSVILSKMNKDGSVEETQVSPESGSYDEYTSFAENMIHALEGKSVQKLADCLKAYHQMIMAEDEAQDMEG